MKRSLEAIDAANLFSRINASVFMLSSLSEMLGGCSGVKKRIFILTDLLVILLLVVLI